MTTVEFNKKFNKLEDQLFAFAMKLTRNKENAKDLMQETAMRAYGNRHRFQEGTYFKSWITTIMYNSFVNHYRKQRTRNKVESPIEKCMHAVGQKAVTNTGDSRIMMKELDKMVNSLNDGYRKPFEMFFEGYHYDEISAEMNIPMGTVKSRIFYARKQLKEMVVNRYGTPNVRRA
jgi:RNA polymerase sigma-70 factor (ECF subfamily)